MKAKAEAGDAEFQVELGLRYEQGERVAKDQKNVTRGLGKMRNKRSHDLVRLSWWWRRFCRIGRFGIKFRERWLGLFEGPDFFAS